MVEGGYISLQYRSIKFNVEATTGPVLCIRFVHLDPERISLEGVVYFQNSSGIGQKGNQMSQDCLGLTLVSVEFGHLPD